MAWMARIRGPNNKVMNIVMEGDSSLALWALQLIEEGMGDKMPVAFSVENIHSEHPLNDLLSRIHAL